MAASTQKDTIYIDIDEEITGIIEKVRTSKRSIVALVLPKRATALQSVVNMKLLQRAANDSGKKLVLITNESALLPLAGAVGLHVAKTLQSKPAIPSSPKGLSSQITADDVDLDETKSVGELAGLPDDAADADVIEVDNGSAEPTKTSKKGAKPNKKLMVPNFEKFRIWLFLGIAALIALIIGWYWASFIAPNAQVTIKTDTSTVNSDIVITLDPNVTAVNKDANVVPAKKKELKKTDTEKVPATGTKNIGQKATGTVTLKNCTAVAGTVTLPGGTVVSNNGLTFVINQTAVLYERQVTGVKCTTDTNTVSVTAQNPGDVYNISGGRAFTVIGYQDVVGMGSSNMSGGTTANVKMVTQADVDAGKQKILDRNTPAATDELKKQFKSEGMLGVGDSLVIANPTITTTPNVGDEGADVTVNAALTYSMLGVKPDDLKTLVDEDLKSKIDVGKQGISDYGLDKAVFKISGDPLPNGSFKIEIQTDVTIGPKLDAKTVKTAIAGKKKGDAKTVIQAYPGVKDADVKLNPFWVSVIPKNANKVKVTIIQANGTATTL